MTKLTKWTRPSNYIGPNHDGYYIGLGQNRDSDILAQSNFAVLLERLGGETPFNLDTDSDDTNLAVQVIRDSHWACGWIEYILVHETAADKVAILSKALTDLDNYPILDENDHSEREYEEQNETLDSCMSEFTREIAKVLGIEEPTKRQAKELEQIATNVYHEDCGYRGFDSAWVGPESIARYFSSTYSGAMELKGPLAKRLIKLFRKAA